MEAPDGFSNNDLRASDIDKASIHWLKTGHQLYRRFDTSIDPEILSDVELKWYHRWGDNLRCVKYWILNQINWLVGLYKHWRKCMKYKQVTMSPGCPRCNYNKQFFIIESSIAGGLLECTRCNSRYKTV